ncbi:hypothetical protein P0R31_30270 [Bradyrhizobium yuanmingense]|uniref:hypothetical protein n=1 Tax=Bradyrhizobium yuanmingense TaxID=108015 RepID=UPI0023B89236|nr:hypothetical protein [Bradyrhizobium yuanmingense]MDF0521538.1 hypothetical protein [Bradyrhizobium yuanmingense]
MNAIVSLPLAAAPLPTKIVEAPASRHPDARVFELVDAYLAAERRYSDAAIALDRRSAHVNPPEVLRIRPRDFELGKKLELFEASDEYWYRPCDIGQWKSLDGWQTERHETADCMVLTQRRVPASEELKARGEEIVAAWDAWYNKRPRGFVKAEREMKRASAACFKARKALCEASATTVEGLRAKLRCLEIDGEGFDGVDGSDPEPVVASLLRDIQRMVDTIPA